LDPKHTQQFTCPKKNMRNNQQMPSQRKAHKSEKSHQKIINTMLIQILSPIAEEPHVHWADILVESVHTRPRTLPQEVSVFYYSRADMNRFERGAKSPRRVRWADALVTQIPVISKRRILKAKHPSRISEVDRVRRPCCSVKVIDSRSHEKEMELARPRAKRRRNASDEEFVGQLSAKLMAVSQVGDSEDESDSEDDGSDLFVDNRPDDPMDISGDLPLLSISGAAREVPPRETSTKGRRLRKELESSLDGCYWAMRSATRR
jgi:hypothetical protein